MSIRRHPFLSMCACLYTRLSVHNLSPCVCAQVPAYRLKLPPKRLFNHSPTPDFVEERRQQLDSYLQMLLQERRLQGLHSPPVFRHAVSCKPCPGACLNRADLIKQQFNKCCREQSCLVMLYQALPPCMHTQASADQATVHQVLQGQKVHLPSTCSS